jgi:uncharacterized protein
MKYFVKERLSENMSRTPDGFLVCLGVPIARTGIQIYGGHETPLIPGADGLVHVEREEDQVFHPKTIASFEGKPVTINHPEEFVNPENWSKLAKGSIQNVRRGKGEYSDSLIADVLITDAEAIQLVESGEMREVSCGYEADYEQDDEAPGIGRQMKIVGNHLALVDEGRAGSSYAIRDHKTGKVHMSKKKEEKKKWTDKISSIFAKAQTDAHKIIDEAMESEAGDESLGGEQSKPVSATAAPAKPTGDAEAMASMMGDFKKMCDAVIEKLQGKGGATDAEEKKPDDKPVENKEKSDDAEGEGESDLEGRLSKLEQLVSGLIEKLGDKGDAGDEDPDAETGDEDESEESEDDDFESSTMVGDAANDTASRAEILSPGIKMGKDVKERALKAAYSTKDGEKILKSLNGGKAPTFDSKEKIEMLFVAASELMKSDRARANAKTKDAKVRDVNGDSFNGNFKTPAELNEINAKAWSGRN